MRGVGPTSISVEKVAAVLLLWVPMCQSDLRSTAVWARNIVALCAILKAAVLAAIFDGETATSARVFDVRWMRIVRTADALLLLFVEPAQLL